MATEDSLPGPRHRHRAPRILHTGIVATAVTLAATLLAVVLAAARSVTGWWDAPPSLAASGVSAAVAYRPCPLTSCAGYPVPSQVRGITIAALQNFLFDTPAVKKQITAAITWNVNAIRLQIVQDKLVGAAGNKYASGYMANIRGIVTYALHRHLNVILNAQTEMSMGYSANENLPTAATSAFWQRMISYYGDNPHVVFDLFNEPGTATGQCGRARCSRWSTTCATTGRGTSCGRRACGGGRRSRACRTCSPGRASCTASTIPVPRGRGRAGCPDTSPV